MSFPKFILYLLVLIALPGLSPAQDITGLWTGYIESSGSRIPYEVVISANGDKWNGYALTAFTFNETENIGIKTIELKEKKGALSLEDHDLVYDYYKTPPRRIKMIATLVARGRDSSMVLEGSFFTRSLDFRSQDKAAFTGIIHLRKQNNNEVTRLTSRLAEMNLLASLSFARSLPPRGSVSASSHGKTNAANPEHKDATAFSAVPQVLVPSPPTNTENKATAGNQPASPKGSAVTIEEEPLPAQKERVVTVNTQPGSRPVQNSKPLPNSPREKILVKAPLPAPVEDKPVAIVNKPVPVPNKPASNVAVSPAPVKETKGEEAVAKPTPKLPLKEIPVTIKKPELTLAPPPAAALANRKTEVIQNIFFTSDSLVLSIYDNGTIDGDTVSVVLNGQVILARKGLTANAIRTTIPVTPAMGDSLQLVMYAENLGSIPPNTGLLIVQDGDQRYDIRFAGDMKKSSAVVLRRKR